MKIAIGPLWAIRASGWFGRYTYARLGMVANPYPLALRASPYPYRKIIHGWGAYYHPYGWVYERRRTWHGLVNVAKRATVENVRRTAAQQVGRSNFAEAVGLWQGMDQGVKDFYNKHTLARRKSGYNLFISRYLTGKPL